MPRFEIQWAGDIVEYASDSFIGEFASEGEAEDAGYLAAGEEGVDDAEVYVTEIGDEPVDES